MAIKSMLLCSNCMDNLHFPFTISKPIERAQVRSYELQVQIVAENRRAARGWPDGIAINIKEARLKRGDLSALFHVWESMGQTGAPSNCVVI